MGKVLAATVDVERFGHFVVFARETQIESAFSLIGLKTPLKCLKITQTQLPSYVSAAND